MGKLGAWAARSSKEVGEAKNDERSSCCWSPSSGCWSRARVRQSAGSRGFEVASTVQTSIHGCQGWQVTSLGLIETVVLIGYSGQPALPAWLEDYQSLPCEPAPPKVRRPSLIGLGTIAGGCSRQSLLECPTVLKDRLRSVTDAIGVRQALYNMGGDTRKTPLYSSFVFKVLLSMQMKSDVLADCLTDPALNISEARNLEKVILDYAAKARNDDSWQDLMKMVKEALNHGTVSDHEIRSILRGVPLTVARYYTDVSKHAEKCFSFYLTIWGGIQTSKVFSAQCLDPRTLELMLSQLSRIPFASNNCLMAIDIVKSASLSQLHHMAHGLSIYLYSWAQRSRNQESVGQDHIADFVCIPDMLDFINLLPLPVAQPSVSAALSRLLTSKQDGAYPETQSKILHPFIATIALADRRRRHLITNDQWQAIELKLDMRYNNKKIAPYLSLFNEEGKSGFFFRRWLPKILDLTARSEEGPSSIAQRRFEELCAGSPTEASYCNIILAHHQLNLPYHTVLKSLLAFMSNFCTDEDKDKTITMLSHLNFLRARPQGKAKGNNEIFELRGHGTSMLLRYRDDPYLHFHSGTDLGSSLAGSDAKVAGRILQFLQPLPSTQTVPSSVFDQRLYIATLPKIDFIHKLALSFAHFSRYSRRLAFRYVCRCYGYLKLRKATIQADMSRALVHAGIIRYLRAGEWVSTMRLRWILGIVRQLEGDEVADQIDAVVYEWRGQNLLSQVKEKRRYEAGTPGSSEEHYKDKEKYIDF